MIFTKYDTYTSDEKVENLTRGFNIHYRSCIGSLIYLLSTRVDLNFAVHNLSKFSENLGKLHLELLVHLLRYIRDNKTLGLKYYSDMNDTLVSDLLRQVSIKTENHLMDFSDSSWQDCTDTRNSIGSYIIFYQGGPIDHGKHVTRPVDKPGAEREYNAACTVGMSIAHFSMLIHEFLNKDTHIVTEEAPMILLYSRSAMCMAKNGKDTKHTRHIARRMYCLQNGEKCKMHNTDWCEGGLQLAEISTKNVGDQYLTPRMKYIMLRIDN